MADDCIIEWLKIHGREVNWRNYFALNYWDENYRSSGQSDPRTFDKRLSQITHNNAAIKDKEIRNQPRVRRNPTTTRAAATAVDTSTTIHEMRRVDGLRQLGCAGDQPKVF